MTTKYTKEDLANMSSESKDLLIISMQDQLEQLNANIEKLIEQVRIADQYRFGRHSEKMDVIDGQLSLFDEAESLYVEDAEEPDIDDVIPKKRKKKTKGKRDTDLDSFEQKPFLHDVTKEELDAFFGSGNWKAWHTDDVYKRLRYEYQKGRDHHLPLEYYKDFNGVLVTDGLQQYHLVEKKAEGITNANCWAHARRDYSDAVKAASRDFKDNPEAAKKTIAYQALQRIGTIYNLEGTLKELSPDERLKERQTTIKPLVDEYFTWVKEILSTMLPKGKTAEGLNYSINQEQYLRIFLTDGEVPIDNSAAERSIRTFCVGKKNWLFFDSVKGADASAAIYSVTETAKINSLHPYKYLEYLLTELPKLCDKKGDIEPEKLDPLMPWSSDLPDKCRKPRA